MQVAEDAPDLVPRKHHREAGRPGRTDHLGQVRQIELQDVAVQEEQRLQRLVLR